MYFDRNATKNGAKRSGSGGMHRRPNAAWVLPQAVQLEEFKTYWGFGAWALTLVAVVFLAYIGKTVVAAILASGIGLLGIGRILTAIRGGTSSE